MNLNCINTNIYKKPYIKFGQKIQIQKGLSAFPFKAEDISAEQKFNSIISPWELKSYYESAGKYFGIDFLPKLNLITKYHKGWACGYNFKDNVINMNISDLLLCEYKILGKKNEKIIPLIISKNKLPMFSSKEITEEYVKDASTKNYYGYDSMFIMPLSKKDKQRYIIQRLVHELIHAQQQMILRKTDGIGEKAIFKAWFHYIPKNNTEEKILSEMTEKKFKKSFWASKNPATSVIKKDSELGKSARKWFKAIQNYSGDTNSAEYEANELEKDANLRAAKYVRMLFGPLIA